MSKYLHLIENDDSNIAIWLDQLIHNAIVSQSGEIGINTPTDYASYGGNGGQIIIHRGDI